MNTCPYCSHNLLRHLRSHDRYWYCLHCRLETSDSFITAQNSSINRKFKLLKAENFSVVSSI